MGLNPYQYAFWSPARFIDANGEFGSEAHVLITLEVLNPKTASEWERARRIASANVSVDYSDPDSVRDIVAAGEITYRAKQEGRELTSDEARAVASLRERVSERSRQNFLEVIIDYFGVDEEHATGGKVSEARTRAELLERAARDEYERGNEAEGDALLGRATHIRQDIEAHKGISALVHLIEDILPSWIIRGPDDPARLLYPRDYRRAVEATERSVSSAEEDE
ncbi:MAG: hypothetical protein AB2A00_19435 [Myxococcota bacterium]